MRTPSCAAARQARPSVGLCHDETVCQVVRQHSGRVEGQPLGRPEGPERKGRHEDGCWVALHWHREDGGGIVGRAASCERSRLVAFYPLRRPPVPSPRRVDSAVVGQWPGYVVEPRRPVPAPYGNVVGGAHAAENGRYIVQLCNSSSFCDDALTHSSSAASSVSTPSAPWVSSRATCSSAAPIAFAYAAAMSSPRSQSAIRGL